MSWCLMRLRPQNISRKAEKQFLTNSLPRFPGGSSVTLLNKRFAVYRFLARFGPYYLKSIFIMFKEFKEFAMKGSLVDIAVAFVMGAAFKEVVTSFTSGVVSPIIGLIFKADFKALKYVLQEGSLSAEGVLVGESAILWGAFLMHIIDFFIVAFVMFLVIKGINRLKRKEEEEAPAGPTDNALLFEIRDLLKK